MTLTPDNGGRFGPKGQKGASSRWQPKDFSFGAPSSQDSGAQNNNNNSLSNEAAQSELVLLQFKELRFGKRPAFELNSLLGASGLKTLTRAREYVARTLDTPNGISNPQSFLEASFLLGQRLTEFSWLKEPLMHARELFQKGEDVAKHNKLFEVAGKFALAVGESLLVKIAAEDAPSKQSMVMIIGALDRALKSPYRAMISVQKSLYLYAELMKLFRSITMGKIEFESRNALMDLLAEYKNDPKVSTSPDYRQACRALGDTSSWLGKDGAPCFEAHYHLLRAMPLKDFDEKLESELLLISLRELKRACNYVEWESRKKFFPARIEDVPFVAKVLIEAVEVLRKLGETEQGFLAAQKCINLLQEFGFQNSELMKQVAGVLEDFGDEV